MIFSKWNFSKWNFPFTLTANTFAQRDIDMTICNAKKIPVRLPKLKIIAFDVLLSDINGQCEINLLADKL